MLLSVCSADTFEYCPRLQVEVYINMTLAKRTHIVIDSAAPKALAAQALGGPILRHLIEN